MQEGRRRREETIPLVFPLFFPCLSLGAWGVEGRGRFCLFSPSFLQPLSTLRLLEPCSDTKLFCKFSTKYPDLCYFCLHWLPLSKRLEIFPKKLETKKQYQENQPEICIYAFLPIIL